MASRNKSKSSGLRMLWIPGGRKSHSKGRFDSTTKSTSYGPKQKKSEVWSLGGSRAQRDLLDAEPDTSLLDSPTSSIGITPIVCTVGAVGTRKSCTTTTAVVTQSEHTKDNENLIETTTTTTIIASQTTPTNSTASTLAIESTTSPSNSTTAPNSPVQTLPSTLTMPSKTTETATITTTTAEIIDDNRFAILDNEPSDNFSIYDLPNVPADKRNDVTYNSGTVLTTTVAQPLPPPPTEANKEDAQSKQKSTLRNHNNNHHQVDINSIQSMPPTDNNCLKALDTNLDWIDELYLQRNGDAILQKGKHKKKKKHASGKELDQLDGVPNKLTATEPPIEEDEKVVKCLYYTLMCCDCTIS